MPSYWGPFFGQWFAIACLFGGLDAWARRHNGLSARLRWLSTGTYRSAPRHARRLRAWPRRMPTCICTPPLTAILPICYDPSRLFSPLILVLHLQQSLNSRPFIIYSVQSPSSRITHIQSHTAAAFRNPLTIFFLTNMYIDSTLVLVRRRLWVSVFLQRWRGTDFL